MGKNLAIAIRTILVIVWCYFIYRETGLWTTLAIFTIFIFTELDNVIQSSQQEWNKSVTEVLEKFHRVGKF